MAKTIQVILKSEGHEQFLLSKAKAVPKELLPKYERGTYPEGSARIVNNAIHKIWKTMRSSKQIPIDKQISGIVKKNKVLFLKIQTELIPIRIKEVPELDELLIKYYRAGVVWLKGRKWVADILVNVKDHYVEGKPEVVIGVDLGKWHNAYSMWIDGKEAYRAFDKFGDYHFTIRKITHKISEAQQTFEGTRRQLTKILKPLYEKRKMVLRQYYGTLRNKILQHIPEGYNAVFVIEDLESLPRAELRKAQRTWAHQELANGIFFSQLEWNGYKVVKVNARGTTHTCWKCGEPVKSYDNRTIICKNCYPKGLDRDLNGARNIARRYMLSGIGEHSCTPNDRLSSISQVQAEDNRENPAEQE
jgi:transposase